MGDLREVIAPDYEAIIEAASTKMRANQTGVRGQMITPRDDFSWWVMQETADAALAAIKQAGFVVVPEPEAQLLTEAKLLLDEVVGDYRTRMPDNFLWRLDQFNARRAMIEASNG